jgi:Zn-dependent protease with chaperone function
MVTWTSIAALSVIVSYLITCLLGVASFLVGLLLLFQTLKTLSFFGVIAAAFTLTMGGTVLWSLLPGKARLEVQGVPIDLSRETRLRAEVAALANALNEKMPDEVYLVAMANAAVLQYGKKRIMLLGLPLLELLTISHFRAILAHEFGHYYAGDTRMAPWVFRARVNMAQVITRLGEDSTVLSFLSRWVVLGILRLAILGLLSLWWKLFNLLTQHVSRKQEYRCDELACYLAGSENLEKGLCSVRLAAATFAPYWNSVVAPVVVRGFRPQLADGYKRFLQTPEIAKAASTALETALASDATGSADSHPPLKARIEKARSLAIPTTAGDDRPAVTLFEDLPWLELLLLTKVMPALKASELKPMQWDTAGSEVYVPLWRGEVAKLAPDLNSITVHTLPNAMAKLSQMAGRMPDPPGTLLTREQRAGRAAEVVGYALALALIDHGWKLHLQPGQSFIESEDGIRINPQSVVAQLCKGNLKADTWLELCQKKAIGDFPLVAAAVPATN